jgi:hypothetical protein
MAKTNAYRLLDVGKSEWKIYGVSEVMWLELEAEFSIPSSAGMRGTLL